MKMISSDNAKTLVILTAIAAAGYVVYKMFAASGSIKDSVMKTVHEVDLAATKIGAKARAARAAVSGVDVAQGDDQSAAESARLHRQDDAVSAGLPPAPVPEAVMTGEYRPSVPEEGLPDWMLGGSSRTYDARPVAPDEESPAALGYPL